MRALSTALKNAQQAQSIDALLKILLAYGASSYTYTITRILDIEETEDGSLQSLKIMLDNSDKMFNELNLKGYKGVFSLGAVTGSGDEYSAFAPMWVKAQRFDSVPGKLVCTLSLEGICNLLADDKADENYLPDNDDEKTVKTLINEIIGADIDCFAHCHSYDIVWDSEDDVIDDFKPKDKFRIYHGNNRLSAVNRLLDYTKCVMRAQNDGKIHIFNPITTGTDYDYTYSLESGHTFFSKASRERLVIPNYIRTNSEDDDDPQYNGSAIDTESHDRMPKREFYKMHLESDDQAEKIAEAMLAKFQMWSEAGSAEVPMNVGAEVFDYVKVTDEREDDYRVGNIGRLTRHYTAGKNVWRMTFTFGDWQNVRKALANLNLNSDDLENYFARLSVKDLYAENIMAENCDFVWLDPDNTIDLSKIGDNLDNLPDGEVFARVKSLHLDAGQVKLDENILYKPGYNPNDKFDLGDNDLDDIPEGTLYQRVKSAALTPDGLVVLDNVEAGTYGLVKSTSISAGQILLSKTVKDGEWYNESGLIMDATAGMVLYGGPGLMGLRTYPTLADYLADTNLQCYVGTDGMLYAGGGTVFLSAEGLTIKGQTLYLRDSSGNLKGYVFGHSNLLALWSPLGVDIDISVGSGVSGMTSDVRLGGRDVYLNAGVSGHPGTVKMGNYTYLKIPVGTNCFKT